MHVRYITLLALGSLLLSACGMNMYNQPKAKLYEVSPFFADGSSSQQLPEGVISRERGAIDPVVYTGQTSQGFAADIPFPLTLEVLERGQQRYNIYCAPCHNFDGNGLGLIVQKGMVQPASFHEPRLRDAAAGYYYNAITNGFGRMYGYASRIPPEDRWAITAYIRALQLSQYASPDDVPEGLRDQLNVTGAMR